MYFELAGKLANRLQSGGGSATSVVATNGSLENLKQLVENRVQLALMQESSVRADQVAVVAPLFYEAVHILVPTDSLIESISQLENKKIMMGTKDSGTYQTASRLLKHFGLTTSNTELVESDWTHTDRLGEADVIIAVTKVGHLGIAELLKDAKYRLISIDNAASLALEEPMFRLYEMPENAYQTPSKSRIFTLRTTALLVVRRDASSRLVKECLQAIYKGPPATEGLIALELAANWQGLPYHEAARQFFASSLSPQ
jgi:eukaryotic-like serine/threonine-protein kinase